jgi:chromosome segregation ATPase
MAKVFQSLRGAVQDTFHRPKTISDRVQGGGTALLNDAMQELENVVVDKVGQLKAAVRDSQAMLADEAEVAQEENKRLSESIAVLEARLRETEEAVRKKSIESQAVVESLSSKIAELEGALNKKNEALESRSTEVSDLNSRIAALVEQGSHFESRIQEAADEATREALRADSIRETSQVRIATLETQLRNTEEIVARRDAAIKALEENLTDKIQHLENQLSNRDEVLLERNKQVKDLKAELKRLTSVMKKMSSVFRQAEALADIDDRDIGGEQQQTDSGVDTLRAEENPDYSQQNAKVTDLSDTHHETVPRDTFDRLIGEIARHTNVMTPLASLVILDHVEALGESMESFPQRRLSELLEAVSREISDDKVRAGFRERLGKAVNAPGPTENRPSEN